MRIYFVVSVLCVKVSNSCVLVSERFPRLLLPDAVAVSDGLVVCSTQEPTALNALTEYANVVDMSLTFDHHPLSATFVQSKSETIINKQ